MNPFSYPPWILLTPWVAVPSCPNGISDTLRPLPSEWAYLNVAGKPIPCFRDAVMLKSACRYAFVGISGRSSRPRVFIGFSSLWPRVDAGSNPAGGTNNLSAKERRWKKHSKISHTSSHALPTKENRRACKSAGGMPWKRGACESTRRTSSQRSNVSESKSQTDIESMTNDII